MRFALPVLLALAAAAPAQSFGWRGIQFHGIAEPIAVGNTIALMLWATTTDVAVQFAPGSPRLFLHGLAWFATRPTSFAGFLGQPSSGCNLPGDRVYYSGPPPLLSDALILPAGRSIGPIVANGGGCVVNVTNYMWSVTDAFARGLIASPVNGWN